MTRTVNVYRMLGLGWQTIVWPLGVLAVTFAVNLLVWAILAAQGSLEGSMFSAGPISIFVVMFIGYLLLPSLFYPFALAMGVTRRTFLRAIAVGAVAEALVYGTLLYLLRLVEVATGGWGVDLAFFDALRAFQWSAVELWLLNVVGFLLVIASGLAIGAVFKRWSGPGVLALGLAVSLSYGAFMLAARSDQWVPLSSYAPVQWAAAMIVALAVLALLGWVALRRAAA